MPQQNPLIRISRDLARDVDGLQFQAPVQYVYNPLIYARAPHERYLKRFGGGRKEVLLVGMNPGPFGMAQTGVPFGDAGMVRDWMGIEEKVRKPPREHPKRPVLGFDCNRSEVSGARLWGWARDRFGTPERFFAHFFVYNYCPLSFIEESGRNRTPDKLPASERQELEKKCDRGLQRVVETLQPRTVLGIGAFAEKCVRRILDEEGVAIGRILHPSPASPKANRGWSAEVEKQFASYGITLPDSAD